MTASCHGLAGARSSENVVTLRVVRTDPACDPLRPCTRGLRTETDRLDTGQDHPVGEPRLAVDERVERR